METIKYRPIDIFYCRIHGFLTRCDKQQINEASLAIGKSCWAPNLRDPHVFQNTTTPMVMKQKNKRPTSTTCRHNKMGRWTFRHALRDKNEHMMMMISSSSRSININVLQWGFVSLPGPGQFIIVMY